MPISAFVSNMRLPAAEYAIIDAAKIRDYLLSPVHPVGRFKATFFGDIGYAGDDWEQLAHDIREIVTAEEATPGERSEFGQNYEVWYACWAVWTESSNRYRLDRSDGRTYPKV